MKKLNLATLIAIVISALVISAPWSLYAKEENNNGGNNSLQNLENIFHRPRPTPTPSQEPSTTPTILPVVSPTATTSTSTASTTVIGNVDPVKKAPSRFSINPLTHFSFAHPIDSLYESRGMTPAATVSLLLASLLLFSLGLALAFPAFSARVLRLKKVSDGELSINSN
jgi:hypothetical protein